MAADSLWIVDDITVKPGQGKAFVDAYMREYAPGAVRRGMTLLRRMVEPAVWVDDQPNRILFVWTVPDAAAVWATKFDGRGDPSVISWWTRRAPAFIESRTRMVMGDVDELEELSDV